MLRQSIRPQQGASAKPFSPPGSLQSYISDCRKIVQTPALTYNLLLEKVKAASNVHVPSTSLTAHAFADGALHLVGPRFVCHLLIIALAAVVATVSGISTARMASGAGTAWEFEPFANRSLSQAKSFIEQPSLPATTIPQRAREADVNYEVVSGDTVSSIAAKFEVSIDTIVSANKLDDANSLHIGDKLVVPPISGILHTVRDGDTVDSIATKYQVDAQVIKESEYNHLEEPYNLFVDQKVFVPGGKMPEVTRPAPAARSGTRPADTSVDVPPASSAPVRGGGRFVWPTGGYISQYFSGYHPGIDIGAPYGAAVYAAESGVVVSQEWLSYGYGWNLIIDHGDGYTTQYSHLSKFYVSQGQRVTRGQPVGAIGTTGLATGPHLDFRMYQYGGAVNPVRLLP